MSRSGYCDDCDYDQWTQIMWRGAVNSAMRGRRGQELLRDMLVAFDALPAPELIAHDLVKDGQVCALGAVGRMRGIAMEGIDPEDYQSVARVFGIASALAREIVYMNDEGSWGSETPAARFQRMRAWVAEAIKKDEPKGGE